LISPTALPPASIELNRLGIPHRIFMHPAPIHSLEQAAAERGQTPGQVVRSILFRLGENEFVLVLAAGPGQIPWVRLRRLLNQNRLTMASNAEVVQITGYQPGTVSPLALKMPLRILADRRIFDHGEISLGSGQRDTAIILTSQALLKAVPHLERVDLFTDQPETD